MNDTLFLNNRNCKTLQEFMKEKDQRMQIVENHSTVLDTGRKNTV